MDRIDRTRLADILLSAPGWARLGLAAPDAHMRAQAADTLAATILRKMQDRTDGNDAKGRFCPEAGT